MRRIALTFALLLAACTSDTVVDADSAQTIYLVRHAEKTTDKTDPALTAVGEARAIALADRLADAGITIIYSTDTRRTRDTAAPLAARLDVPVTLYDASDLEAFAAELKATPATSLVVGHSNTTPQLVEALGGEGGSPIVEATEYDRLYVVKLREDGVFSSVLERFGAPTQ